MCGALLVVRGVSLREAGARDEGGGVLLEGVGVWVVEMSGLLEEMRW
jgi:hypothetical protein